MSSVWETTRTHRRRLPREGHVQEGHCIHVDGHGVVVHTHDPATQLSLQAGWGFLEEYMCQEVS